MNSKQQPTPGILAAPGRQYITVKEIATNVSFSSKYIIGVITLLLQSGILISPEDIIVAGTKNRRKFRVHKDTGVAKIMAHLQVKFTLN